MTTPKFITNGYIFINLMLYSSIFSYCLLRNATASSRLVHGSDSVKKRKLPSLAHQLVPKAGVRLALRELEAAFLVDRAGG
jgi:hypothetical protein